MIEKKLMKYTLNPIINIIGKRIEKKHFSKSPIFIVACPRSGTTMLLSILSAHPNIYTIQKQTYAFRDWKREKGRLIPVRIDRLYRELILKPIKKSANRWCEKTPRHSEYISEIQEFLPKSKVICLIRDGRDVVTSKHPKHKPDDYWVSYRRWTRYIREELAHKHNPNVYFIKYEDIINNYVDEIKKLLDFLDEDFTEEMDDWFQNSRIKNSIHLKNGIQKLHKNSIERWKDPKHKKIIAEMLQNDEAVKYLKQFGYIRDV